MAQPEPGGGDTTLAAVAYILSVITGIIVYIVADDDDTYARFHGLQAIGYGIVMWVIGAILGFILAPLAWGWTILYWIGVIILAVKAYQGESIRLPVIADIADDHA